METLIWVTMCSGIALIGSLIMMPMMLYFICGYSKEEVISNMKSLIIGEELD